MRLEKQLNSSLYSLPLRREVSSVLHSLHAYSRSLKVGMSLGFTNAGISELLSQTGGYWISVETTAKRCALVATVLGAERVLCAGADGELPFEDKQFDVVVVAQGVLRNPEQDERLLRECHRVLNTGGLLLFTVPYRKRFGFSQGFLGWRKNCLEDVACLNEADVFQMLKAGFDVLGIRHTCRFCVQRVRQWVDWRKSSEHVAGLPPGWIRVMYALAQFLDMFLFWTRGYQMTVAARRKGWREKQTRILTTSAPISDAILCDPRHGGKHTSLDKFK